MNYKRITAIGKAVAIYLIKENTKMKTFKYSELTVRSQVKAAEDYRNGWLETHPNDNMTIDDAIELCFDSDDEVLYTESGEIIDQ